MGIRTYAPFLLDVLFKKKLRTRKDDFKIKLFRGVIDPAEILHKLALTLT
jgi:hypothetical protein